MKRQDILEIIVSNPKAVFVNANWQAGKYSDYPAIFQVLGMTHDKSYVRVKQVNVSQDNWLKTEDGENYLRDEDGKWIEDTRPLAERVNITYGTPKSMPTRLVLKSDKTEQGMVAEYIAKVEKDEETSRQREEQYQKHTEQVAELNELLYGCNILTHEDKEVQSNYSRQVYLSLDERQVAQLVSVLKSALVEVGV